MLIENLVQTGSGCPCQWEFETDYEWQVYVRYRGGMLGVYVTVVMPKDSVEENEICIFREKIGQTFDGFIEFDEARKYFEHFDVKTEVDNANARDMLHDIAFKQSPDYRRMIWQKSLDKMNETIQALNDNYDEKVMGPRQPDYARPFTREKMEELLDEYELEYVTNPLRETE
jgi:hypothetical protein